MAEFFGDTLGDLRFGLRALGKHRGLTAVAILSLALGVGANTTIFALLNAIFFRPMPVRDQGTLAAVFTVDQRSGKQLGVSYPNYIDFRDHNTAFSSLLLYTPVTINLTGNGSPRLLMAHLVSPNYFDSLGVRPELGRAFTENEDAVVITHALWMRLYGGEANITSRTIELNARMYRVVGVAPDGFLGLNQLYGADLFLPVSTFPQTYPAPRTVMNRRAGIFSVVGRRKVPMPQAEGSMQSLAAELTRQYPAENRDLRVRLIPADEAALSEQTRPLLSRAGTVLMTVSALVLLIACANVAGLLMARGAGRNREIAIRLAMGATRWRIVRQLLMESLVLAAAGGVAGLAVAAAARSLLWSLRPPIFKHAAFSLDLDARVLGFTFAVSVVTGVIFGLLPALRATRADLATDLKERGSASGGLHRILGPRSVMVMAQVALSVVALVGACLFVRSLLNVRHMDMGFDAEHLGILVYNVTEQGYNEARGRAFHEQAVMAAERVPFVDAVSLSRDTPFHVAGARELKVEGFDPRLTLTSVVTPRYFHTMRIPLLRGRDFADGDVKTSPRVMIVNQAAANLYWPGQDPVGKHVVFPIDGLPVEVIGVVRNANYKEIGEAPQPMLYLSMLQYYLPTAVMYIRTTKGDPAQIAAEVKTVVQRLEPNFMLQAEGLDVSIGDLLWVQRLAAGLLTAFGVLALLLASVGLYGVIDYSVRQRRRELGVRLALGATLADVRRLILTEGMRLVAIGVLAGAVIALSAVGSVSGMLYLSSPRDVFTFALVPSLLILVGLASCWFPARRASLVDPAVALRDE